MVFKCMFSLQNHVFIERWIKQQQYLQLTFQNQQVKRQVWCSAARWTFDGYSSTALRGLGTVPSLSCRHQPWSLTTATARSATFATMAVQPCSAVRTLTICPTPGTCPPPPCSPSMVSLLLTHPFIFLHIILYYREPLETCRNRYKFQLRRKQNVVAVASRWRNRLPAEIDCNLATAVCYTCKIVHNFDSWHQMRSSFLRLGIGIKIWRNRELESIHHKKSIDFFTMHILN